MIDRQWGWLRPDLDLVSPQLRQWNDRKNSRGERTWASEKIEAWIEGSRLQERGGMGLGGVSRSGILVTPVSSHSTAPLSTRLKWYPNKEPLLPQMSHIARDPLVHHDQTQSPLSHTLFTQRLPVFYTHTHTQGPGHRLKGQSAAWGIMTKINKRHHVTARSLMCIKGGEREDGVIFTVYVCVLKTLSTVSILLFQTYLIHSFSKYMI